MNGVDTRGRILAIDYGEKNIGIACCDALRLTVRPLPSIPNAGRKDFMRKMKALVSDLDIREVILGIPLNMDGSGNDSVLRMERWLQSW